MAEKKVDPTEKGGKNFRILVDDNLKGNFPDQREVVLELTDDAVAQLSVFQKDIPTVLKGVEYKNKTVRWLNNFGMKKGANAGYEPGVTGYTVTFDKIDGATEYVYYDGPTDHFDKQYLHTLDVKPVDGDSSKVRATLFRGDPATGWIN